MSDQFFGKDLVTYLLFNMALAVKAIPFQDPTHIITGFDVRTILRWNGRLRDKFAESDFLHPLVYLFRRWGQIILGRNNSIECYYNNGYNQAHDPTGIES
jgi:hypothetical protein